MFRGQGLGTPCVNIPAMSPYEPSFCIPKKTWYMRCQKAAECAIALRSSLSKLATEQLPLSHCLPLEFSQIATPANCGT
ncbi:hypothetical protein M433DRAFT_510900 [Acidomyces richmondensis BFW]|nr:MAG: hypothetical protein FE78DRAFT_233119 [Acidomyces sp. 'richmondensis']KYG40987.1 hypothetical protein M433DRAFT_510900 [Acidomyces richmondensis BFW]